MQINKINLKNTFIFLPVMFILSFAFLSFSYAESRGGQDPVSLLQYIANNMIAGLKSHQATLKTKPQIVYQLANRYVVPYADLPEMSRRVLPPQIWNQATPGERARFQKLFTTTLIRTYASALTSYQDQTVRFYPVRGGSQGLNTVVVNSQISGSGSEPIQVSYRMIRRGNAWRLIDLSVEGVSMLESFRSQFSDILSQGSMAQLLNRMSAHNTRRGD